MKIEETFAEKINPGDKIRLQFMGGTEDVEVTEVIDIGNDTYRFYMSNSVVGLSDVIEWNQIVRKVVE